MKKTVTLIVLLLAIVVANAQDEYQNNEIQTIFSKSRSNGG